MAGAAKKAGATKETAEQVDEAFKSELGGVRQKLVPHIVDIAREMGPKVAELNVAVRGPLAELRKEIEPKAQELKEALVLNPRPSCCRTFPRAAADLCTPAHLPRALCLWLSLIVSLSRFRPSR